MRFVDSHLHLEETDLTADLTASLASQTLLLSCGVDRGTSESMVRLAKAYPAAVRAFVGVHPSEAKDRHTDWVTSLLPAAEGLGEVGLDPKYSDVGEGGVQMEVFTTQLQAAEHEGKPVQVHSRGAEPACLEVMSGFNLKSVLMHWFQSEEELPRVLDRGYFVSYGPAILYSKKLQRMAARGDHRQVLVESDSPVPYTPLGPARGPSLIPSVVFKLGELWGCGFEDAREAVLRNSLRYIGAVEKG